MTSGVTAGFGGRWPEIEVLLDQALDLPESERADFLRRACGDPALRAEVEAILDADRNAGEFLARPAADALSWEVARDGESAAGRRVGHYRLDRVLGSGGMGEVYQAHDQRLERTVALKRIRWLGGGEAAERRRRFHREARLAAGLEHPSIVAIHDFFEHQGEDWLVMELVDGQTLASCLEHGPLAEDEALELARRLAGALEAAHAAGILHRDLKTENVLVTPRGWPKLLDFGLAKRPGDGVSGGRPEPAEAPGQKDADLSLTQDGHVLGTLRAMSPEQATGGPLDARSDLFSFGILLYEMVTATTPFAAPTTLETLLRICHQPHEPARQRNPSISAGLSRLIDGLLEKRPERRPSSAGRVGAALERLRVLRRRRRSLLASALVLVLVLAASGLGWWRLRHPPAPRYVAVIEPVLGASAVEGAELMASGVHAAAQRALSRLRGVAALPGGSTGRGRPAADLARSLGADEALTSRLDCPAPRCRLTLSRLDAADGRVLWLADLEVPMDDLPLLDTAVVSRLYGAYAEHPPTSGRLAVPHRAFATYLSLRNALRSGEPPRGEALLADLATLRRRFPAFLEPYLLEAEAARELFVTSRDARHLEHAAQLLRQAERLADDDRRLPGLLFDVALERRDLPQAQEALDALDRLEPGGVSVLQRRAQLWAYQGRGEEALALMRRAVSRRPMSPVRFNLALMEVEQGEIEAAKGTLEKLLARDPGYLAGASLLADLEVMAGSPERAVELYRQLLREDPNSRHAANLGTAHLLLGDYASARRRFTEALDGEPRNAVLALNLADAHALLDKKSAARRLYLHTLELVARDPAAPGWQQLTVSAQALSHLGRHAEAREAVAEALRMAPDHPQVAFEAALVLSVIGDHGQASIEVRRALDLGLDRRWFELPWFAPLPDAGNPPVDGR